MRVGEWVHLQPPQCQFYSPDFWGRSAASVKRKKRHLALTPRHQKRRRENAARARLGPKLAAEAKAEPVQSKSTPRPDPRQKPGAEAPRHEARERIPRQALKGAARTKEAAINRSAHTDPQTQTKGGKPEVATDAARGLAGVSQMATMCCVQYGLQPISNPTHFSLGTKAKGE